MSLSKVILEYSATFNVLSVDLLPKTSVVTYDHADRCHTIAIDGKIYDSKAPNRKNGLEDFLTSTSQIFPIY